MSGEAKRGGRLRKEAPLTGAERTARHRARKRAAELAAVEGNPEFKIRQLQAALDAAHARLREKDAQIADLNLRLADANRARELSLGAGWFDDM